MQTKYEEVADFVVSLVDCGTLRMGMRAPSLRRIARDRKASMSTVLHAYRLLEDRGVLEARPKSGFYIASHGRVSMASPKTSQPPKRPSSVTITGHVTELLEQAANPDLVPLGCAIPSADLLAAGRLDKFMARAARSRGSEYNIYTEPRGLMSLREEICRRVIRWGQALSPDDVLLTIGCTEALSLSLRALTSRGDTVAIESP
ncbi:MAG: GntR family transcriptional regulator, partial [Pseudomonadota bacterium]